VQVDVLGWFRPQNGERSGRFRSVKSVQVLSPSTTLKSGDLTSVRVGGGDTGVPAGASAVVVQALASGDSDGYLTVKPTGVNAEARPLLAFGPRRTERALLVVPVGDDGRVNVRSEGGDAAASLRIVGWYS
jgi:hypothetical protein